MKLRQTLALRSYSRSVVAFLLTSVFVLATTVSAVYTYTRVSTPARAYAATSSNLNFQARLLGNSGSTVADGYYNVEFKLYNVSSGGVAEWTETRTGGNTVRVANGYLSVALGDVTAFPGTINWDQDHWLTMNIGGTGAPSWDGEMTPRLKLTAVPYAFQAKQAEKLTKLDGANTGILDFLALTANRTINLPDQDGTLCIQGSADCVDVATTNDTALTSSNSGLEISSDGLRLLGGCADGQVLAWDETAKEWKCTTNSAAVTVRETDGTPSLAATTLEFGPATNSDDEFIVSNQGGGVSRIRLGTTVLTTNNFSTALDPVYVNASESPAAGDITGSFAAGLTIGTNSVALGTDTVGDYIQSLGTLTGLSVTGNSGEESTPALSVLYGSGANTAVQGNTTLVCASGSGNLAGGGNTITLGAGGTCGAITTNNDVTFSTAVRTPLLTNAGALTVSTTGANDLTISSGSGLVVLGATTLQASGANFNFDVSNAGNSTFNIVNNNGSNVANLDVEGAITAGNANSFSVNGDGDITGVFTALNGTSTANGGSGAGTSTTLVLNNAGNFDVGNYVQMNSANCGGTGINPCYAKITAKATNTLTITPALRWTTGATVNEYHIPEIGGVDTSQGLTNRYGRGYFISGVATGNGTTYYNENSIETSLDTFNLLNENVTTLNIGGGATTITLGSASTDISVLGSLQTAASETITAGGGLVVSSGGAVITGGIDNNSGGLTEAGAISGVAGLTFSSGSLNIANGGITNAGSVAGATTINASGLVTSVGVNSGSGLIQGTGGLTITGALSLDGALSDPTGNLVLDDQLSLGSATIGLQVTTDGVITDLDDASVSIGQNLAVTSGGITVTGNSSIAGTLTGLTGLTVSSGGASITGGLTVATGGLNLTNTGITNTGSIAGVTTIGLSGAISGATATNTINGLVINSGNLSSITGYSQTSGNFGLSGGGTFSIDSSAFDVTSGGALSGITTINASGLVTTTGGASIANSLSGISAGQAQLATLTNSTTSGNQYGLYVDNAASTGTTEALLVLDNSDTDTAVTSAVQFVNAGGGFTNLFDVAGTLISSGEFTLLDGRDGSLVDTNDAVAIAITGTGALDAGSITSNFGAINVGTDNITTTGLVFANDFDRSTAGALTFGNTNATSVSICNSANCDTLTLANNADADTITIGDALDTFSLTSTGLDVSTAGALSGITTIGLSGAISGATATNTINGLIINSGSLSGITGYAQTSGNFAMSGTGTFGTGTGAVSLNGNTGVTGTNTFTVGTGTTSLGGALTTTGLATFNGGVTIQTGDTLTVNGDALTDLVGNGLVNTTGVLTISLQTGSGMTVSASGLTNRRDCANNQILKWATGGGGAWNCAADGVSDARLKENIASVQDGILDKIKDVRAVTFDYRCDDPAFQTMHCDTDHQTGVIAQEIAQIFPELVNEVNGHYEVNYKGLGIYNLKAVSELARSLDSGGNATLTSATIANGLTVNGTIVAGTIRADHIEGLDYLGRVDEIEAKTDSLDGRLTAVEHNQQQNIDLSNLTAGAFTATGDTSLQNLTVNLDLIAKGALEVDGKATFKEAVRFEKDVEFDGQINVLGYSNVQGLTVNLDLMVKGAIEVDGKATFKEAVRFEKDVVFEKDVAVKGQATFNRDTAGIATIKQGETSVHVKFDKEKPIKPIISLTLGEGKFAQYSYRNVTKEGFDIILLAPAPEDYSFSWVAIQTEELAEGVTP